MLKELLGLDLFGPGEYRNGQQAMTADEIQMRQLALAQATQQAFLASWSYLALAQNPQRPLDERYADFKVRLSAAIEKRKHD